jgi:hypothetical protein
MSIISLIWQLNAIWKGINIEKKKIERSIIISHDILNIPFGLISGILFIKFKEYIKNEGVYAL